MYSNLLVEDRADGSRQNDIKAKARTNHMQKGLVKSVPNSIDVRTVRDEERWSSKGAIVCDRDGNCTKRRSLHVSLYKCVFTDRCGHLEVSNTIGQNVSS